MTIEIEYNFDRIQPLVTALRKLLDKEENTETVIYLLDQLIMINDDLQSVNELKQTIKELRIENLNQYRTICNQLEEINRLKG